MGLFLQPSITDCCEGLVTQILSGSGLIDGGSNPLSVGKTILSMRINSHLFQYC